MTIIVLSCESVSAQWYLFPGRKKKNAVPEKVAEPVQPAVADTSVFFGSDESLADDASRGEEFSLVYPDVFRVALILPFQANGTPSSNFLEMYGGALLAVKEAGRSGREIELTVLDENEPATPLTSGVLEENHLVIGPVNYSDIRDAITICPEGRFIVSPLDPKAATFTDSCRVIQGPVQWKRQADELAKWIVGDAGFADEIVVFKDIHNVGEQAEYLLDILDGSGCRYRVLNTVAEFEPIATGTTRAIIASSRDSFINGLVRDLSVLVAQKHSDIVLYGTSTIRGSLGVDIEHLHNLRTHYTTGYFIDYDDPAVSSFILSYRALFKNEPGQFAFQGYDTMRYFLGAFLEYGEQWYKKLPEYSRRGLQTDYFFKESEAAGNVNTAVRKIILGKDFSSIVVK